MDAPRLIDSHCHLQSLKPDDRERALDAAREAGVTGFLVPGIKLRDAEDVLGICHRHDDVWCSLGVHPHDAASWQDGDRKPLAELLADEKVVAVGECGLDFYYDNSPREVQGRVMREQWGLAIELGLPVIVHNRDSDDTMREALREPQFSDLTGDFHSFAGGLDMADELIDRGFYLGVTGMVTFKAADNIREILRTIPSDRMMVETDTPYLAPVPHRGKPNEPAYVVEVARRIAEELDEDYEVVCDRTGGNFFRLFERASD